MKIKNDILNGRNEGGSFVSFGIVNGTQGGYYSPSVSDSGELTWTASDDRMPEIEWRNIVGPPATTDKTLLEAGKMADAQVVGDKFASVNALLKNAKNADSEIERRLTNLEYALDDYLYRPFTDDTPAYIKTVPDGVLPKATLDSYGGKSLVWNQLCSRGQEDRTFIASSTTYQVLPSDRITIGHKYLFKDLVTEFTSTTGEPAQIRVSVNGNFVSAYSINTGERWKNRVITLINNTAVAYGFASSFRGLEYSIKGNAQVFDLTEIFGEGNEPTADEFNAMFPDDYYPYNEGEIRTAPITAIVTSVGTTIEIPEAVRSLPGYGETGAVVNFETQKYTAPDGTEIDISNVMPNNELQVEADGTITFENEHKLPVPNQITYLVKTEGG